MVSNHTTTGGLTVAISWAIACAAACSGTIGEPAQPGATLNGITTSGPSSPSTAPNHEGGASGAPGTTDDGGGVLTEGAAPESSVSASSLFSCISTTPDPGPTSLLMLTRAQYINTLQGLFGSVLPDLSSALGADDSYQATQFGLVQADIDLAALQSYQAAAEGVAAAVVGSPSTLGTIAPCGAAADKRGCAQSFVQTFGALAYRAPIVDPTDIARHMALYDVGAATSHEHGLEMVLRGMLQSPRFLYRVEVGTTEQVSPTAVKLSGFELAARLSYDVWNTLPDAILTQAAATGGLTTKAQVAAQLTRMLQDPRGNTLVRSFLEGLTQLSALPSAVKDPTLFPAWSANGSTLPASMQAQARAFFDSVLGEQGGTLSSLLTSSTVFVNKDLAGYYGVTGDGTFQPLQLPAGQAAGLLTLPALLTLMAKPDESWPIYRGQFVRQSLLCQQLPPPPPNVPKPPAVEAGVSTRERLSEHETNPACSGCHALMDPIGFGFESYDAVGRYRTTDGNQPIDSSGYIGATEDINGPFNGVAQLAARLAGSVQVQACIPQQWFRFMMNRFEQDADNCSLKSIVDSFEAAGTNLNALPQALVQSDAFMLRRPVTPQSSDAGAFDSSAEGSP